MHFSKVSRVNGSITLGGAEKREILEKEISELNSLLNSADVHLLDEIQSFKNNREKDLLLLFKKFFKNKYESTEEVRGY